MNGNMKITTYEEIDLLNNKIAELLLCVMDRDKQNSELQAKCDKLEIENSKMKLDNPYLRTKCDELEDALRLNKAGQDVYIEASKKIDGLDKKLKIAKEALEKVMYLDRCSDCVVEKEKYKKCEDTNCFYKTLKQCLKEIE